MEVVLKPVTYKSRNCKKLKIIWLKIMESGNVKFVAKVYVDESSSNLYNTTPIAVLKTTPNNAGVGIFSLQPVLENFVKPDNKGTDFGNTSTYKTVSYSDATPHPIHLIDKFATSNNAAKYFMVEFFLEYSTSQTGVVSIDTTNFKISDFFTCLGISGCL